MKVVLGDESSSSLPNNLALFSQDFLGFLVMKVVVGDESSSSLPNNLCRIAHHN